MKAIKAFLNKSTIVNCLVFALVISILFAWRHTYTREIPLFSLVSFQIYLSFVAVNFLVFLGVFFILFLLGRREEK